jgi:DNA repair protein RecN (Recombination protein N)
MLRFISIDNFALIDHLETEFQPGLNLITGETGSGKSILVDAVGLLIGARASLDMIREGHDLACVEGVYEILDGSPAGAWLEGNGYPREDELIIRREISRSGTNRIFVNGRLTTLSALSKLGSLLVDIHGQHAHQMLLQPATHLAFLDAFAGLDTNLKSVRDRYEELSSIETRLRRIQKSERERLHRLDLLDYQLKEIEGLDLSPGMDVLLEEERQLLASAERRLEAAGEVHSLLYEHDSAVLSVLETVRKRLEELASLDRQFSSAADQLRETRYQLEELAFQARDYASSVEFNPARLEKVEEQLAELDKIKRKYGETVDEVLGYAREISEKIEALDAEKHEATELTDRITRLREAFLAAARELSRHRKSASSALCEAVERELAELAMPDVVFQVQMKSSEDVIREDGIDEVEFLISANPGEPPKPLAKIASGGELSRVMLALKSISKAEEYSRTLVFDEVDAGIGGRTATSLGEKLSRLSRHHQVFCVTHLSQVAALADQHFHVGKRLQEDRTLIQIGRLDREGRIEELSRMLAGEAVTETTRKQAREMLEGNIAGAKLQEPRTPPI